MRLRNGFVSNSSSSSFILRLKEVPTSIEHLSKMLGLGDFEESDYDEELEYYGLDISKKEVLSVIYRDIMSKLGKNPENNKFSNFELSDDFGLSEYEPNKMDRFITNENMQEYLKIKDAYLKLSKDKNNNLMWGFVWDRMNKMNDVVKELIKDSLNKKLQNTDDYFIEMVYGDEDGSTMGYIEHSGILDPITFMKFNHH